MEDEIKEFYEKVQDKMTEEQFMERMDYFREKNKDYDFLDDEDFAEEVINECLGDGASEEVSEEVIEETSSDDLKVPAELKEFYNKVKDKMTEEQFMERLNFYRKENEGLDFMDDNTCAEQVVQECLPDELKLNDEFEKPNSDSYVVTKIADLKESGKNDYSTSVAGTVMSIGDPKVFQRKKGKPGKLANVEIEDDTGKLRTTFWTENIKLLKNFNEGEIIQINNVAIKKGYYGDLEATLSRDSTVIHPEGDFSSFPQYTEDITKIEDITPDMDKVNLIGRIIRVSTVRTFEKEGRDGKVATIVIMDDTGEIDYTLWNASVDLIKSLNLEDGDTVKILGAVPREGRDGEITLNHRDGRIIKGDFEAPTFENEITKIIEVKEQDDVNILGVITKIQDIKTFTRNDGSEGKLRSFEVQDDTGSIRVTVWGNDADIEFQKGEIVKIVGGAARYDEYTSSGYSLNTNWNTQILQNPSISDDEEFVFDEIRQRMGPISIESLLEFDDDGVEVDVMGRIISCGDLREFQRDDGTVGTVRSVELSDGSGLVTLSLWGDKAEDEFEVKDAYMFENARTRMGMYSVDLNIGSTSRIRKLTDDEAYMLPAYETIEDMIYSSRTIDEIDEDDQNIRVIARIFEINEPRTFDRDDGTTGSLRKIEIADNTGTMNLVIWNEEIGNDLSVGDAIKIDNPRVRYNDNENRVELQTNRNTSILTPSEDEAANLPTFDELQELIYQERSIDTLEETDTNIRIKGVIVEPSNNRILLAKCPHCNNSVDEFIEEGANCDFCGEVIEEPRYTLMIPARLRDLDSEEDIAITFFGKLAEELIDMTTKQAAELIEETDDLGVLDAKIEDLDGLIVELIADVDFDQYSEQRRLKPKKIISKDY